MAAPRQPARRRNSLRLPIRVVLPVVLLLGTAAGGARAQSVDLNMWVTNGSVNAIATSGNTIYLGGTFTRVGPSTGGYVGIDAGSGTLVTGWPRVTGRVFCSTPDGTGGFFIGGNFTAVAGVPRQNLAHVRADRTLDGWNPGVDGGSVRCLARSGTTVYAGGYFTTIGGQSRSYIAALDAGTGLATAWNAWADYGVQSLLVNGSTVYAAGEFTTIGGQARTAIAALDAGTGQATAWNPAPSGGSYFPRVCCLALSGTTLYAAGDFGFIGGQSRSNIAALDAGTGAATAWNPGAGGSSYPGVYALALSGTTVYAGGDFTVAGGENRSNIAALDAGTGLATAWNPGANGYVNSIVAGGAAVYAGGYFTSIGGQARSNVAALDAGTGMANAWNPGANDEVMSLAVSGSTVWAGGDFGSFGGLERRFIAALDAGTGQATAWNPGADSTVSSLAVSGSTVYAGGYFTSIGGQNRSRIAALDAGTGMAKAWSPGANGDVYALAVSGSTVYAGGCFTSLGGQGRAYLAALDAGTGLATAWNPGVTSSDYYHPGVYSLAVSGSTLYAGGNFDGAGGQSRSDLAALDAGTGLATAWNPSSTGNVLALAVSGATVYAGGYFAYVGGQYRHGLAALDAGAGLATAWNPGADAPVLSLAVSGTTVYVGGEFSSIGGQMRGGIAALDAGTGLATAWDPEGGASSSVYSLVLSGTTMYAAGSFRSMDGQARTGFAAIGPADAIAPTIQVVSPNGGTPLLIGSQRQMSWIASDNKAVQSVDLHLSRTGPMGPWELLAAGAANTGSYLWTVAGPAVPGNNAYLLVNARDNDGNTGSGLSHSGFAISATATDAGEVSAVTAFALSPPAPNPATARSLLSFALPVRTRARLTLVDVQGREVAVLADGVREAGRYAAALDASTLHAGIYFVRMQAGGSDIVRRVVVVR